MRVFISGGCKNGKSYFAQRLAKAQQVGGLYYIATMRPVDAEDEARIERHKNEREGWGFTTVEQHSCIEGILDECDRDGSFLLDSLTALLADEMFRPDGSMDKRASERVIGGLSLLLERIGDIVIVSDYVFSDAIGYDLLTEQYRKALAEVDRAAAKLCDVVLEVSYAGVTIHKGAEMFGELYEKCA